VSRDLERQENREMLDPRGPEFAFAVAKYAWWEGLTVNHIAKRLGLTSSATHLMQVKRALKRAGQYLAFTPPVDLDLAEKLDRKVNGKKGKAIRFTVVKDELPRKQTGSLSGVVSAKAANIVAGLIHDMLQTTPDPEQPDIVVCNAGGRTISEIVRALLRNPPAVDEPEEVVAQLRARLVFVAGNTGYLPNRFNQSANFLSVTMAELFGAEHQALPMVQSEASIKAYRELVDRTSLFICGVGTRETGLIWEHFHTQGLEIPMAAAGDIAFNLLDKDGREITLPERAREFMATINPGLTVCAIQRIAKHDRVLLVLDGDPPEAKREIGIAALKGDYPTDVVLGSKLARAIHDHY
jgi:DNA-binding transcriptional regulator LsrR (DeoR family)